MKIIKIIIEKNDDGFWAFAENERNIVGGGDTVKKCKQDVLDCIETLKELGEDCPQSLKDEYKLSYKFDAESLLSYYQGIFTNSAFERLTGINQKQIQHYSTGLHKPRKETRKKIQKSLHQLGEELLAVEL